MKSLSLKTLFPFILLVFMQLISSGSAGSHHQQAALVTGTQVPVAFVSHDITSDPKLILMVEESENNDEDETSGKKILYDIPPVTMARIGDCSDCPVSYVEDIHRHYSSTDKPIFLLHNTFVI